MTETATRAASPLVPPARITQRWRDLLAFPLVLFVLDRVLLFGIGASHLLPAPRHTVSKIFLPTGDPLNRLGDIARPWFRFDARWYADVTAHGYHWGSTATANTNFLPLFPLLSRIVEPLTWGSPWAATWLTANACEAVALVLLWAWARTRWPTARALPAMLVMVAFPFSFFTAAPYAEPLFLALAAGTFLLLERGRPRAALLCAAASSICRPVGLALVAGLVAHHLWRGERREAAIACLGALPLAAFALYLGLAFGHPLGFTVYHTYGWVSPHGGLLTSIGSQFNTPLKPFDRIDVAAAALFLVSSVFVWRRLGPGYGVFVLLGVALPLVKGLAGMERYVSVLFPAIALWGASLNKGWSMALFAVSLLGLVLFTIMFTSGYAIF
jgi:hypothetical protein